MQAALPRLWKGGIRELEEAADCLLLLEEEAAKERRGLVGVAEEVARMRVGPAGGEVARMQVGPVGGEVARMQVDQVVADPAKQTRKLAQMCHQKLKGNPVSPLRVWQPVLLAAWEWRERFIRGHPGPSSTDLMKILKPSFSRRNFQTGQTPLAS